MRRVATWMTRMIEEGSDASDGTGRFSVRYRASETV